MELTRRALIAASGGAVASAVVAGSASAEPARHPTSPKTPDRQPKPHLVWTVFSRHLQWLTTQAQAQNDPYGTGVRIGQAVAELGYSAVDLTVRSGGHVEPANVIAALPPMLRGLRSAGVTCDQITAGIVDLSSAYAMDILRTAAGNGVRYYRFGNYKYSLTSAGEPTFGKAMIKELDGYRKALAQLATTSRKLGLVGLYYTFSGANVGASLWDIVRVLDSPDIDTRYLGIDYASAHVIAEGAAGSWQTDLRYAMPFVRGISLGDTTLTLSPGQVRDVGAFPGTGIVNWSVFYTLLRQGSFNGPLSALFEYPLGGVSLNNTWWSDTLPATVTPADLKSTMSSALAYHKAAAAGAGWTAAEQT